MYVVKQLLEDVSGYKVFKKMGKFEQPEISSS